MLVTSTQRRGGEVFGQTIATGLAERGWDIELRALVRSDGPSIDAEPLVDKPREALRSIDLDVIRALLRTTSRFRPDIVFANGGATLPASIGALGIGKPKLVYGSIGEPLYWARTDRARRRTGFFMRRCGAITAISGPTLSQIVDGLGVDPSRVVVAHPGVEDSFFDIEALPQEGALKVLYLGSLAAEKGAFAALPAFEMAARREAVQMRFVGGGPLHDELRAAVEARELESVDVVGPVADVSAHLGWADVLVLASESEGLPGVILEAGAAGVPTVAFDVGGVSDVVVDGDTGVLVDRADVDAMGDALADLAANRERRSQYSEAIQSKVRTEFGLKASLDRYDDILRALYEGRPLPSGDV